MLMAVYLQGRYLSAEDTEFVQFITCDIYNYLKVCENYFSNILLFPPILNYYRFLIHKTIEEFPSLNSFSIGEGDQRKTVITTIDLINKMQKVPKMKRPDRAIYVPRHCRLEQKSKLNKSEPFILDHQKENSQSLKNEIQNYNEETMIKSFDAAQIWNSCPDNDLNPEELSDEYVYKTRNSHKIDNCVLKNIPSQVNNSNICRANNSQSSPLYYKTHVKDIKLSDSEIWNNISNIQSNDFLEKEIISKPRIPDSFSNNALALKTIDLPNDKFSELSQVTKILKKKPIPKDKTNSRIQSNTDDSLVDSNVSSDLNQIVNSSLGNISIIGDAKCGGEEDGRSDDSWSEIFNENGDLLNKEEYQEICEKVGKVSIQSPQFNYFAYSPREIQIDDDDFGHLLEIYDFTAELKSEDIHLAFLHVTNAEFDIKWVDDTHAILIFPSNIAAKKAIEGFNNPKMKLRLINWASRNTKLKVKKFSGLLLPHKARPVVVANVARNMVANALGVRLNVNKDILNREKKIIRDARDSKIALKKSKQAAWDGFTDN